MGGRSDTGCGVGVQSCRGGALHLQPRQQTLQQAHHRHMGAHGGGTRGGYFFCKEELWEFYFYCYSYRANSRDPFEGDLDRVLRPRFCNRGSMTEVIRPRLYDKVIRRRFTTEVMQQGYLTDSSRAFTAEVIRPRLYDRGFTTEAIRPRLYDRGFTTRLYDRGFTTRLYDRV